MLRSLLSAVVVLGALALGGFVLSQLIRPERSAIPPPVHAPLSAPAARPSTPASPPAALAPSADCAQPAEQRAAAEANAAQSTSAPVSPFGLHETGWAIYAPLIGREIGAACPESTPAFAAALARWQGAHGLGGSGIVDEPTLAAFGSTWLLRRPFVRAFKNGCPAPAQLLAPANKSEGFGGKTVLARPAALAAYRRMVAAARAAGIAPPLLQIASAFRGPDEEAARCADGGCGDARKAHCSAHRTGLAFDLYLSAAPGSNAFSTDDGNRLYQSRAAAYRWLVHNADRFGFLPYPFEPWHWEWTGEAV